MASRGYNMDREFVQHQSRDGWMLYATISLCLTMFGAALVVLDPGGWLLAPIFLLWAWRVRGDAVAAYVSRGRIVFVVRCQGSEVSWRVDGAELLVDLNKTVAVDFRQSESGQSVVFEDHSGSTLRLREGLPFDQCEGLFLYLGQHFRGVLRRDGRVVREAHGARDTNPSGR